MNFSERLRRLIEEKDITQKQLALDLHIPVSTLGGYVQGTSEPDFETLKRLAKYFEVSCDYLLGSQSACTSSFQENELLRIFRMIKQDQRELFIEQGRAIVKYNSKKD